MKRSESGFALTELATVVLIIGVLVSIAIPVSQRAESNAKREACYSNQRLVESAVQIYATQNSVKPIALQGVVDKDHPLVQSGIFKRPPRCAAGPTPASLSNPDSAHGAYTVDGSGNVEPCPFGSHELYYSH